MKEKIVIFIIGLLVGAVIATGAIYLYSISNSSNNNREMRMNGGTPPSMPNGERREMPKNNTQNNQTNSN